ncbi:zinc-binding dehydrogenase [Actinosynnema sp. CA-299493]
MITAHEVRLVARPDGAPRPTDFRLAEVEVPEPGPGQVLVRNTWLSIDPYIRLMLNDSDSEVFPPFALDGPVEGAAIGEVVATGLAGVPVGATVAHFQGWREYGLLGEDEIRVVDVDDVPPQTHLGLFGLAGLTAYAVLTDVTPVEPGDTVFISAAAGAVGSVAGQLARKLGATRVIGSAGGPTKVRTLVEHLGYDVGIDYREEDLATALSAAAPDGIDLYVDHVGGAHLDAALAALKPRGRAALVGAISGYNEKTATLSTDNLFPAVEKELTLRGMQVTSHLDKLPAFTELAKPWLRDGTVRMPETTTEGIHTVVEAFIGVLNGANTGKTLVRL